MHAIVDIDSEAAAAAHLYGLPTDEFISSRNELVRQLRAEGDRELAAVVALLRRPTVLAAELNRVLRLSPSLVSDLLLCADALRVDHQRLLEGEPVDVSSSSRAHRHCAAELAELASRDQSTIQSALEAASLDEDLHPKLLAATFATEPTPQTGFDLLTPTATVSSLSDAREKRAARVQAEAEAAEAADASRRTPPHRPTTPTDEAEQTTETPEETSPGQPGPTAAETAEARKALRLARRRVEATTASHDKAEERVANLEQQLEAARGHVDDTATKLAAAQAAEDRATDLLAELGIDPDDELIDPSDEPT